MFKRISIITSFILLIMSALVIGGCAGSGELSPIKYNGKRIYSHLNNLPADYPTKHLPNGNMWPSFIKDMGLTVDLNNRWVHHQLHWWVMKKQGFLNNGITRGAQYFYYIYQQTRLRHLPSELSLIPLFESSFVPVNNSNRGAAGIWQFIPATARGFGIRIDKWYDGRSDIVSSTNAALKYLTYLYYFFDKDWLLAIAAYNWGPGNVQRAILRNKRAGLRTDFWSLRTPRETREYVPKLLALAAVIKDPHRYGVNIEPINNGPYFEAIRLGEQISLNKIAKLSNASEWTIKMLNAGYKRGVTYPSGPSIVLVPHSKAAAFKARIQGKTVVEPSPAIPPPAAAPATSATTTKASTAVNIPSPASTVKKQEQKQKEEDNDDLDESEDENTNTTSANNDDRTTNKAIKSSKSSSKQTKHVVKNGETLFSIARKYNVTTGALRRSNKLNDNSIKPRQTLRIPIPTATNTNTTTTSLTNNKKGSRKTTSSSHYTSNTPNKNASNKTNKSNKSKPRRRTNASQTISQSTPPIAKPSRPIIRTSNTILPSSSMAANNINHTSNHVSKPVIANQAKSQSHSSKTKRNQSKRTSNHTSSATT